MSKWRKDDLPNLDDKISVHRQNLKQRIISSGNTQAQKLRIKLATLEKECNQLEYAYLMEREEHQMENRRMTEKINSCMQSGEAQMEKEAREHSNHLLDLRGEIEVCLAAQEAVAVRAPQLEREMEDLRDSEDASSPLRDFNWQLKNQLACLRKTALAEVTNKEDVLLRVKEEIQMTERGFQVELQELGERVLCTESQMKELDGQLDSARRYYAENIARVRSKDESLGREMEKEVTEVRTELWEVKRVLQDHEKEWEEEARKRKEAVDVIEASHEEELKHFKEASSSQLGELVGQVKAMTEKLAALEKEKERVGFDSKENLNRLYRSSHFLHDLMEKMQMGDSLNLRPQWVTTTPRCSNVPTVQSRVQQAVSGDGKGLSESEGSSTTTSTSVPAERGKENTIEQLLSQALMVKEENKKLRHRSSELKILYTKQIEDRDATSKKQAKEAASQPRHNTQCEDKDKGLAFKIESLKKDIALCKKRKADEISELRQEFKDLQTEYEEVHHQHLQEKQVREERIKNLRAKLTDERERARQSLALLQEKYGDKNGGRCIQNETVERENNSGRDEVLEVGSQTNSCEASAQSTEPSKNWLEIEKKLDLIKERRNHHACV